MHATCNLTSIYVCYNDISLSLSYMIISFKNMITIIICIFISKIQNKEESCFFVFFIYL